MGMLDVPRIHSSAGVPRGEQPLETLYDTYHITYVKNGRTEVGRVQIARSALRSAAEARRIAMQSARFKFDGKIKSAVKC